MDDNQQFWWIVAQITALCMIGPIFGALCFVLATGRLH